MADLGAVGLDVEIALTSVEFMEAGLKPMLTKVVEGVITDDTSTECARTVRLYSRATGRLVNEMISDDTTGEYSLLAPDEEVDRVVLDDDAGTLYNDLIDRVIPGP